MSGDQATALLELAALMELRKPGSSSKLWKKDEEKEETTPKINIRFNLGLSSKPIKRVSTRTSKTNHLGLSSKKSSKKPVNSKCVDTEGDKKEILGIVQEFLSKTIGAATGESLGVEKDNPANMDELVNNILDTAGTEPKDRDYNSRKLHETITRLVEFYTGNPDKARASSDNVSAIITEMFGIKADETTKSVDDRPSGETDMSTKLINIMNAMSDRSSSTKDDTEDKSSGKTDASDIIKNATNIIASVLSGATGDSKKDLPSGEPDIGDLFKNIIGAMSDRSSSVKDDTKEDLPSGNTDISRTLINIMNVMSDRSSSAKDDTKEDLPSGNTDISRTLINIMNAMSDRSSSVKDDKPTSSDSGFNKISQMITSILSPKENTSEDCDVGKVIGMLIQAKAKSDTTDVLTSMTKVHAVTWSHSSRLITCYTNLRDEIIRFKTEMGSDLEHEVDTGISYLDDKIDREQCLMDHIVEKYPNLKWLPNTENYDEWVPYNKPTVSPVSAFNLGDFVKQLSGLTMNYEL